MNKLLNWMFFGGSVARSLAKFLVGTTPAFQDLQQANRNNKLLKQLQNEIDTELPRNVLETTPRNSPSDSSTNAQNSA